MTKIPSGRFPFINLAKALERAQQIFENDKGGKGLKMPVAFAAWGYSDKSSGGFQTVGALKQYGLLEDEGSKDDRSVKLTADARHYFLTEIEEDKRKRRAEFAACPTLLRYMLEQWHYSTIDDAVARTTLKTVIGLNDQSARSALGIYKDNLAFIERMGGAKTSAPKVEIVEKFGENTEVDRTQNVPNDAPKSIRPGERVQFTSQGADQFPVPRVVTKVFRDSEHGWFVAVQGERTALPMGQVNVVERQIGGGVAQAPEGDAKPNPIEIFLAANNRLQITADVDRAGVEKLRVLLDKYTEILDLMS